MKYKPKFGRVIIKREIKEKSAGGIIIPDAKRHATCIGIIESLGETAGLIENQEKSIFNIGDKVVFGRHSGAWLDATYGQAGDNDDGSLFICQDADILAVVED